MTTMFAALLGAALATLGAVLGDLVSAEVRHRLDRIPLWIVALASRRLPATIRADRNQEWAAELGAILEERQAAKLPITRLIIGLRFALGVCAATPTIRSTASQPRRARRIGVVAALGPVVVAVGAPVLVYLTTESGVDVTRVAIPVVEALGIAIVIRTFVSGLRRRDPMAWAVTLAFAPMALLFAVNMARLAMGTVPSWLSTAAAAMLMWQPCLVLTVGDRLHRTRVMATAPVVIVCMMTSLVMATAGRPLPPLVLFCGPGVIALLLLLIGFGAVLRGLRGSESRQTVFGTSTVLLGLAILNILLGPEFTLASRVTALAGACGYLLLADPPRWLALDAATSRGADAAG